MGDDTTKGTVEIGPITTVTAVPDDFELPPFIKARNIFSSTTPPAGVLANFVPPGDDQSTLAFQTVELFNFNFLGRQFKSSTYEVVADFGKGDVVGTKTVAGVGRTLGKLLVAAQEAIFRRFAAQRIAVGLSVDDEKAFDTWCALHEGNGGYEFRNGPHFGGSAIDLNVTGCPYTATRTGAVNGGETGKLKPPQRNALDVHLARAVAAYDRAMEFAFQDGATADVSNSPPGSEDPGVLYERFQSASTALEQYFSMAYRRRSKNPSSLAPGETHAPVSFDEFLSNVSEEWDFQPDDPNSFRSRHPSWASGMNGDRVAFLTPRFEQTKADHEELRFVMIHGSMNFDPAPSPGDPKALACNISKLKTRDPCFGFLDLREEITVELLREGLRWGAAQFGPASNGDMMHFDLGFDVRPDLVPDANPDHVGYRKPPRK